MSFRREDIPNPGRATGLASVMAGTLLPVWGLLSVLVVSYIDKRPRAFDDLITRVGPVIAIAPFLLFIWAAVVFARGRRRQQEAVSALAAGSVLAQWTYGDQDLTVAHRIWERSSHRRFGTYVLAGMTLLVVAGWAPGVPWRPGQGVLLAAVTGATALSFGAFYLYFLDRAAGSSARKVILGTRGLVVRGDALLFESPENLLVSQGRFGSEAIPVLRCEVAGERAQWIPIPREALDSAIGAVQWWQARGASVTDR